ncbi:MAG: hypothetical protein K0Q87_72 [Neobacillus sp.]|nr:hypothetical protein [Neobacillus sp.]
MYGKESGGHGNVNNITKNSVCESVSCDPPMPLVERAVGIHERMKKVSVMAEIIHGELFGDQPCEGGESENAPRRSIDESITKTEYTLAKVEDCLDDILRGLRG